VKLGFGNIVRGTERVTLNGRLLVRNTDYLIDYDLGRVTLLAEEALAPNGKLVIDFIFPWLSGN
jgi:cell surface protein SprA